MKLLVLLKSLQPEEHKEFEKFLQSPFFKASEQYLRFFKYLCKLHTSFELKKADLEVAYKRCFRTESMNDTKLNNLASGLSKQIEQFIVVRMLLDTTDKENTLYDQLLVKSLGLRNLGGYFRKAAQQFLEEAAPRKIREIDYHLAQSQVHHQVYFNPDTPKHVEDSPHLKMAVEHLDLYYCLTKLQDAAEMKARERLLMVQYKLPLLDAVLLHTANPEIQEKNPLVAIYHHLVHLYLEDVQEAGFRTIKEVFIERFHELPKTQQQLLLHHLINCGISLVGRDCAVEAELLGLYKLAIQAEMLLDGNRITYFTFINIANLASLSREFDWASGFIDQFSPCLEEDKRLPTIYLAKAGLFYVQGMLDKAQTCLKPEIFQIPNFDVLGRALLIKIVFDRYLFHEKDYEFLIIQLTAFKRFIQTKPLTVEKKETYLNWVWFMRKMANFKFEMVTVPETQKSELRKRLQKTKPLMSKKWLEERIEAL